MYYQDEDRDTDGDAKNLGHPSSTALDSIRYTYLAITIIVFPYEKSSKFIII